MTAGYTRSGAWEHDVTGSRDRNVHAEYDDDDDGLADITDVMAITLVVIVLVGLIATVVVGVVYCVRACCPGVQSRSYGYEHLKAADTDPLLLTPAP